MGSNNKEEEYNHKLLDSSFSPKLTLMMEVKSVKAMGWKFRVCYNHSLFSLLLGNH